jgi:hypothetical protein
MDKPTNFDLFQYIYNTLSFILFLFTNLMGCFLRCP